MVALLIILTSIHSQQSATGIINTADTNQITMQVIKPSEIQDKTKVEGITNTNVQMAKQIIVDEPIEVEEEWIEVNLHISYYTTLDCENSSYGAIDAQGNELKFGTIAIPRDLPLGTQFKIDGYEDMIFTGTDRGSTKYIRWIDTNTMKIDMCIPRNKGEGDKAYFNRVNSMGVTKTTGRYKVKEDL